MTISLDLKPEIEEALNVQAKAMGVSLDRFILEALEDLVRLRSTSTPSAEQLRATLDALAEMGKGLPHIPSSALTRESIYQDHD